METGDWTRAAALNFSQHPACIDSYSGRTKFAAKQNITLDRPFVVGLGASIDYP